MFEKYLDQGDDFAKIKPKDMGEMNEEYFDAFWKEEAV